MEPISPSELQVMELLWKLDKPRTSMDILLNLANNKQWKITTVQTFLLRLTNKGYVQTEKQGRAFLYAAKITKEEYRAKQGELFIKNIYAGSIKDFIVNLYDEKAIPEDELKELKQWFNDK